MSKTFLSFGAGERYVQIKRIGYGISEMAAVSESEFPRHIANQKQILTCQARQVGPRNGGGGWGWGRRKGNCRIHLKVIAQIVVIRRERRQLKMDEMII